MILFAFGLSTTLTTNALELLLPMHIQSETARNIAWDLELHLSLQAKKTRLRKAEKSEPTTRAAKQVMLHLQDKAYK
jgi:hypothetical protein